MNSLTEIAEKIRQAKKIILFTHEKPDGDAVGSALALALLLESMGKEVKVFLPVFPHVFLFLPGADRFRCEKAYLLAFNADLTIALDTDKALIEDGGGCFGTGTSTINIDHHRTNEGFAADNYVDAKAAAVGEIIFALIPLLGVNLSKDVNMCLFVSILADTGGFQHANTTAGTLKMAAELCKEGIDISGIYKRVLKLTTAEAVILKGRVASSLKLHKYKYGQIAVMTLSYNNPEDAKLAGDLRSDIVDSARNIEGVEIAIFLRESEPGVVKVSLRSTGVNVSQIASAAGGGGGHKMAAGCTLEMSLKEAEKYILKLAGQALEDPPHDTSEIEQTR